MTMSVTTDETYMRRCFQLAANGLGRVRPNPLVGCVVVSGGRVVSEGYHRVYGGFHAERNALQEAPREALAGATLYVNLEPCSHHGLTPPCADLIAECGIGRVVCCNDDPNPLVSGRGFERLRAAGVEVVRHVLEAEGRWLNRRFFTFMEKQRPYVILKWAESADGYMSPASGQPPTGADGRRYWISDDCQTQICHKWRTEEAAILVGSQTFIDDRPRLNARLWSGSDPQPVVLDRRGRLADVPPHWLHLHCETLREVMQTLFDRKIQSLIVEGGRRILDAFLAEGLYDEVRVFRNPSTRYGGGLKAPEAPMNEKPVFYV